MISAVNGVQDMEELEGRKHDSRVYKVVLTGGLFMLKIAVILS